MSGTELQLVRLTQNSYCSCLLGLAFSRGSQASDRALQMVLGSEEPREAIEELVLGLSLEEEKPARGNLGRAFQAGEQQGQKP